MAMRDTFSDDEWALMREHPVIGERILRPLPGLSEVATAVRHEHERWDGRGYPDGKCGEDIPLASRIVLCCDAYNALVSDQSLTRIRHCPTGVAVSGVSAVPVLTHGARTAASPS